MRVTETHQHKYINNDDDDKEEEEEEEDDDDDDDDDGWGMWRVWGRVELRIDFCLET